MRSPSVRRFERAQPILPMRPGIPERQAHDYVRRGVTCLFAALNTATGQVTDTCYPATATRNSSSWMTTLGGWCHR